MMASLRRRWWDCCFENVPFQFRRSGAKGRIWRHIVGRCFNFSKERFWCARSMKRCAMRFVHSHPDASVYHHRPPRFVVRLQVSDLTFVVIGLPSARFFCVRFVYLFTADYQCNCILFERSTGAVNMFNARLMHIVRLSSRSERTTTIKVSPFSSRNFYETEFSSATLLFLFCHNLAVGG